jgi:predicted ATPase
VFIYLDEYPELHGHQNILEYLQRRNNGSLTAADRNFEKLVKVADLDPQQLHSLLSQSHEERQQLTNRASAVVTRTIRSLWSDRALKVRFNVDAQHFDTLVSDPNATFEVEVNLDERSRGFRWFFSFYTTFAADTAGGSAANAILLLDEPGLFLHATSQRDLLDHFAKDFKNQIIYTTHSPFMVPVDDLPSIRTVNIDAEAGTVVTNDPTGDYRTLFPLQAALGYDLIQSMFVGQHNLVVEGVSDYWYLSSVSEYLRESGAQSLPPELVITPAGGAPKVGYMATLLAGQRLHVLVLFDTEKDARRSSEEMVHSKLIRNNNIVFVSDAFTGPNPPAEVDIEDLIDEEVFATLVQETYGEELAGHSLVLNDHIPRIVKRYQQAFRELGLEFHKTRPAKLFLRRMADDPESVMTAESQERFEQLFSVVSDRLQSQVQRIREPFT